MSDATPVLKFQNNQLADLSSALTALDGLRTKPDEFRPYRFDDENETIWLISDNGAIFSDAIRRYNRLKKALATKHGIVEGMKIAPDNAEKVALFMAELGALEEMEVELPGLKKISRARLKVGKGDKANPIPSSVLAKLMPLLED